MSVALDHPVLPGETPAEWSARVLRDYYPQGAQTKTPTRPPARQREEQLIVVRTVARCAYCGARTARRSTPVACHAHRDLAAIDPLYEAEPAALPLEESAAGSDLNGG